MVSLEVNYVVFVGHEQMMSELKRHFEFPNSTNDTKRFVDFIFLTQVVDFCGVGY